MITYLDSLLKKKKKQLTKQKPKPSSNNKDCYNLISEKDPPLKDFALIQYSLSVQENTWLSACVFCWERSESSLNFVIPLRQPFLIYIYIYIFCFVLFCLQTVSSFPFTFYLKRKKPYSECRKQYLTCIVQDYGVKVRISSSAVWVGRLQSFCKIHLNQELQQQQNPRIGLKQAASPPPFCLTDR